MKKRLALISLLVILGGWLGYGYQKTLMPDRVLPANVGSSSFSVGWYTERLAKACVVAVPEENFWPWRWLIRCEKRDKRTHLVEVKGAAAETNYRITLISGLKVKLKGIMPVKTKGTGVKAPLPPNPAYGSVVGPEGQSGAGALVYVYPVVSQFEYPVAAIANEQGNYVMDLGDLDQKSDELMIEAVGAAGVWNETRASSRLSQPLPTITIYF